MKRLFLFLISFAFPLFASAQVPEGFNYQALATDAAGMPVRNSELQAKFTILSDTVNPLIIWEELHPAIKTNSNGLFSVVIGSGNIQTSSLVTSFSEINWSSFTPYLKTQIYYQGTWKTMGTSRLWSVPYAMAANTLTGSIPKLIIEGETNVDDEPLFEVRNKDGQTVFAVYNDGVRIYVDNGEKGKKGGFAIGGFGSSKESSQDLFIVNNDSIRAYIDPVTGKGKKGGFAIGGFAGSKGLPNDYLSVNSDSTIIYVRKDSINPSSTFDIIALGQNTDKKSLLTANPDTVNITGVLNLRNDLVVGGDIAVQGSINQVSDVEGNIYKTVKIGSQVWMAENLKTTKYNDGTTIPTVTDDVSWAALVTPAYCWYNNDEAAYKNIYGSLYNWYAVNTGKLCPAGWHVPSDSEFRSLILFIDPGATKVNDGESLIAGGKLKESGTTLWLSPNYGATNESGFSARPGGTRSFNGTFNKLNNSAFWWSATENDPANGIYWSLGYDVAMVFSYFDYGKYPGFSVRCLKDN